MDRVIGQDILGTVRETDSQEKKGRNLVQFKALVGYSNEETL